MKKVKVIYDGGMSLYDGTQAVDFMMAHVNGVDYYAELPAGYDSYEELKAMITEQMMNDNVDMRMIQFFYD